MNVYQVLGLVLLAAVALTVLRAVYRRAERASSQTPWPDTRPRDPRGEADASPRGPQEFSEDTAPAVLSMPVGLEDAEAKPPGRAGPARRLP